MEEEDRQVDLNTMSQREQQLYHAGYRMFSRMRAWRTLFYVSLVGNLVQWGVSWWV